MKLSPPIAVGLLAFFLGVGWSLLLKLTWGSGPQAVGPTAS